MANHGESARKLHANGNSCSVSVEVVEQIFQIYTTHPRITTEGKLNRLPDWMMLTRLRRMQYILRMWRWLILK